ncbi:HEME-HALOPEROXIDASE domain-containing protein [Mycena indigotica]|uniref:HEME-HALOPEROXIDASE domain-containing protein n=1 Tax=Mycena indigotica TaxID=2126181 RepID=A0A8H6WEP6_9AGAR|nr:HEME-HALOPEROXIDASE domain-containing protein [Mycena indigotica]KAF7315032.1 HEME-HALOPEROXIDASE domain-containing protein [Mycena indigotica]
MHFKFSSTFFLVSSLASTVLSCPTATEGKFGFAKPKSTDLRGPCPALNALANHGFLPRDGRNVTIRQVLQVSKGIFFVPAYAFLYSVQQHKDIYNVDSALLLGVAKLGLLTSSEPDTFTLDDIKLHGTIEFDASLSREDFAVGDNSKFNESIYSTYANSNPGVSFYNVNSTGKAMFDRLALQEKKNPQITNTDKEIGFRSFTAALPLAIFGNVTTGVAPKKFVDIWFREERLPFAEGWGVPSCAIDTKSLPPLIGSVKTASRWTSSGGCPYVRTGAGDAPTLDSKAICKQLDGLTKGK